MALHRFWFQFERDALGHSVGMVIGCGVTAWSVHDAMGLLSTHVFQGRPVPAIRSVKVDVDPATLDATQVVPHMGPADVRGIWFPLGYARAGG